MTFQELIVLVQSPTFQGIIAAISAIKMAGEVTGDALSKVKKIKAQDRNDSHEWQLVNCLEQALLKTQDKLGWERDSEGMADAFVGNMITYGNNFSETALAEIFKDAVGFEVSNDDIAEWINQFIKQLSLNKHTALREYFKLRHLLSENGTLPQSQLILDANNHYIIGCSAFDKKDYEIAYKEFRSAYENDPYRFTYASKYGRVLLRRGEYKKSVEILTNAFNIAPSKVDKNATRRNRGVASMCETDWVPAFTDFNDYLNENETSVILRSLAFVELNMNHFTSAEKHARRAIRLAPSRSAPHSTLSIILAQKDLDKGQKKFIEALKCPLDNGDALYSLAQASVIYEDLDQAFIRLNNAVRVDSKFSPRARKDPLFSKLRENSQRFEEVIDTQGKDYSFETESNDR